MIEIRYNVNGKLEYRIIKLGVSPVEWHEWIVVPSVEKEVETPTDSSWRTERVTLEVTQRTESYAPLSYFDWTAMLRSACRGRLFDGESVRVVDLTAEAMQQSDAWDGARQAYSEGLAKVKAERDAARARVAELEANANTATILAKIRDSEWSVASELAAEANAELSAASAASGWMTAEERDAVDHAADIIEEMEDDDGQPLKQKANALRNLLAREEGIKTLTEEISAQNKVMNDWIAAFKILAKIMPGIPVDEDDPVGTAAKIDEAIRQKMTNMSTVIESYARDNRPHDWSAQEMYRLGFGDIKSGMTADCLAILSEKYEQVKKELDEIKNSSAPVAWGVRMPGAKLWRCSSEKQAKKCVEYFGKGEVVALFEKPQPILTKEDIDQLSCIADRLDYAQFYESANSLRSFITRNK